MIYENLLGLDNKQTSPFNPSVLDALDLPLAPKQGSLKAALPLWEDFMAPPAPAGITGNYSDMAYGNFSVTVFENRIFMRYYNNYWELKPTSRSNVYSFTGGEKGLELTVEVTVEKIGEQVVAIQIPLEEEVSPIRFVKQ